MKCVEITRPASQTRLTSAEATDYRGQHQYSTSDASRAWPEKFSTHAGCFQQPICRRPTCPAAPPSELLASEAVGPDVTDEVHQPLPARFGWSRMNLKICPSMHCARHHLTL